MQTINLKLTVHPKKKVIKHWGKKKEFGQPSNVGDDHLFNHSLQQL